jgi:hypothetical protein
VTVLLGGGAEIVSGNGNFVYSKPNAAGAGGSWVTHGSIGATIVRAYALCTT